MESAGRVVYPIFRVKSLHGHVNERFACHNESGTPLNHGDVVSMFIKILGDVVAGVATAYYDCFLTFAVGMRAGELRRVDQAITFEIAETFDVGREVCFAGMASGLDDVVWV